MFWIVTTLSMFSVISAIAGPTISNHPVYTLAKTLAVDGVLTKNEMLQIQKEAFQHTDANGRVTPSLQEALTRVETEYRTIFQDEAAKTFQTTIAEIGGKMNPSAIGVPENNVPLWLAEKGPLYKFRSSEKIPTKAKYLVVGGGLLGSSAAKNLVGEDVVVLERGDQPAFGASGRNGGNIEMLKENFLTDYRGFLKVQEDLIRERFPNLPKEVVEYQAQRQSVYLMKFFQANVQEVMKTIDQAKIKADVSLNGWLRIAESVEEEAGLKAEIEFAKKLGITFEYWTPEQVEKMTGLKSKFSGRFIQQSGNYHPYKYVTQVMQYCIDRGVKFYTQTEVTKFEKLPNGNYMVHTNQGSMEVEKVILATNAYTRTLFPEFSFLEPRVSHISNFPHTKNTFNGMTVTKEKGDWYANFPQGEHYVDSDGVKRGTLHVGGGLDTPIPPEQINNPPFIEPIYQEVRGKTAELVPGTAGQPPNRAWSGLMAFTEDRAPVISFVHRNGVIDKNMILATTCNGYGGSQCAIGGKVAAQMAKTGQSPADVPDDLFSMGRFLTKKPLFVTRVPPICSKEFGLLKPIRFE